MAQALIIIPYLVTWLKVQCGQRTLVRCEVALVCMIALLLGGCSKSPTAGRCLSAQHLQQHEVD